MARFTHRLQHSEVDKGSEVLLSLTTLHVRDNSSHSQTKRSRSKVSLPLMSMGRKLLLSFTLILQIVNKGAVNFKVRLRWLGAVLRYPCKSMFFGLYFKILMIIIHH